MSKYTMPNPVTVAAGVAELVNDARAELAGYRMVATVYDGCLVVRLIDRRSWTMAARYSAWMDRDR